MPAAHDEWALFLDVDGTMVDIAPTPDAVRVSADLPAVLDRLRRRFGGALALISGRRLADLDALFRPFAFPAAGIHGVERRDASGKLHSHGLEPRDLDPARDRLNALVRSHPGLLLEDKGRSLAVHFRLAPEMAPQVHAAMREALKSLPESVHLQAGHYVLELKSAAANKATAIEQFMREPPFAGRIPVFLGDDVTDLDGFRYVERAGGHAVLVGASPQPGRGWLGSPEDVREWLRRLAA